MLYYVLLVWVFVLVLVQHIAVQQLQVRVAKAAIRLPTLVGIAFTPLSATARLQSHMAAEMLNTSLLVVVAVEEPVENQEIKMVVVAVLLFDRLQIDDPVGALSVHLVNGVFGTLCVGIFADPKIAKVIGGVEISGVLYGDAKQFFVQLAGVAGTAVFVVTASLIAWLLIKVTLGLRVSQQEELRGLDIGEHGMEAYSGFQIFVTQ